jgi:hypothetical protein
VHLEGHFRTRGVFSLATIANGGIGRIRTALRHYATWGQVLAIR